MLDQSAIQELKQDTGAAQANKDLQAAFEKFGSDDAILPMVVVPNDCTTISFEEHLEFRTRFRGDFITHVPAQFAKYCSHYAKEYEGMESQVFIDAESMTAKAVLNLGTILTPGHCDHAAKIKCRKNAAFKALEGVSNRRLSQMDLSDFIEDWKSNIAVLGQSGKEMLHGVAVTAVRKATVETVRAVESEVGDFENSASVSERRAAKNKDDLPKLITFTCAPYAGFQERVIALRVGMNTSNDVPSFVLRIVAEEELHESLTNEFRDILIRELADTPFDVFVGNFSE